MNELSKEQYLKTFGNKMNNVTELPSPVIDIWPEVEKFVNEGVMDNYSFENRLVESVYQNDLATFEHVLIPIGVNKYVVIIVNLINKSVKGYYKLDLNAEYD